MTQYVKTIDQNFKRYDKRIRVLEWAVILMWIWNFVFELVLNVMYIYG